MDRVFQPLRLAMFTSIFSLAACGGGGGGGSSSDTPISSSPDITPNNVSFSTVSNAQWNTWVESKSVTIQGIDEAIDISIEGGEYSVNGGAFTTDAGKIAEGDTLVVRVLTPAQATTETTVTVSLGTVTVNFTVTTNSENEKPTASIIFPHLDGLVTELSYYGYPITVTVRGVAADNVAVERVTVAGVDASPAKGDSLETWTVDIPLSDAGEVLLDVEVVDVNGNVNSTAATRTIFVKENTGYLCGSIAVDAANNRALNVGNRVTATDINTGALTQYATSVNYQGSAFNPVTGKLYGIDNEGSVYEINLSDAPDSIVSWDGSSGVNFVPGYAVIDSSSNVLYVLNNNFGSSEWTIYQVDLASGGRAIVADDSYGTGEHLLESFGIGAANGRLFAHTRTSSTDRIVEIDLATGNRTTVSGAGVGAGYALNWTMGFTVDQAGEKAYIGDFYDEIIEVDLASGDRRLVSGKYDYLDTNLVFEQGFGLAVNKANNELYLNCAANHLIAIDLTTGERRQVTDSIRGVGVPINNAQSVRYDSVNDRVLLLNGVYQSYAPEIMSVDPLSGDRAIVTAEVIGGGEELEDFSDFAVDQVSGEIYLAQYWWNGAKKNSVIKVNPETGDRTLVSGNGRGLGPVFTRIQTLELVESESIAYVLDQEVDAIFIVDLVSGNRSLLTQPGTTGSGVDWELPTYMALNQEKNQLYVSEQSTGTIYIVDPVTGHREVFSSDVVGEGPTLGEVTQIRLDAFRNKLIVESYSVNGAQVLYVDLETGDREYRNSIDAYGYNRAAVDPGSGLTYMTDYDGEVRVYDYESGQALILSH